MVFRLARSNSTTMSSPEESYMTLNDIRIRRLALIAAHQIITSPELARDLCQGCKYDSAGQSAHKNGCLTPINTVWELLSKAEEWTQTYCFNGHNTGVVEYQDLEVLRPHIVNYLVQSQWRLSVITVSESMSCSCVTSG